MSKINEKRALKLKAMESHNSSLTAQLEDSHTKVSQLEDQRSILFNNLSDTGKKNALLINDQVEKVAKDLDALRKGIEYLQSQKR